MRQLRDRAVTDRQPPAFWLVQVTSWLVLGFMCLWAFESLVTRVDPTFTLFRRGLGILLLVVGAIAFVMFQQFELRRIHDRGAAAVACLVISVTLLNGVVSDTWTLEGLALAAAVLVAPNRWMWPFGLTIYLVILGVTGLRTDSAFSFVGVSLTTLITAVVLVSMTRLALTLNTVYFGREHMARTQVEGERHRITRGLHDIVGRTLVTATLRNEAALRLLDYDLERSREQHLQLREVLTHGQQELRRLVAGEVLTSLNEELEAAGTLCDRLGIVWSVTVAPLDPGPVATVVAQVVREGVTNMLKHSSPRHAEVTICDLGPFVTVEIVNDGNAGTVVTGVVGTSAATGLKELRKRVEESCGVLETGKIDGQRYRLAVRLPMGADRKEPARELSNPDR